MELIKVETMPLAKEEKQETERIKSIVEDRNKIIAKRFNFEPQEINVVLHFSRHKLLSEIRNSGDSLGIFCGFLPGSNIIHLIHPHMVKSVFKENLTKEYIIMIDYTLTKFYMNQKYYPTKDKFKLYYKYLTEELAKITSGNFRDNIIKFDMRTFVEGKRYTKDKELLMVLYIMLEKSGIDYIFNHLDMMVEDCDIKKTAFSIYKKSIWDLVGPYQKELQEEERKLQQRFRPNRR